MLIHVIKIVAATISYALFEIKFFILNFSNKFIKYVKTIDRGGYNVQGKRLCYLQFNGSI